MAQDENTLTYFIVPRLNDIWNSDEFSDVTVTVTVTVNSTKLKLHQNILALGSSYFKDYFSCAKLSEEMSVVSINASIEQETIVVNLLKMIYGMRVNVNVVDVINYLEVANSLGIEQLITKIFNNKNWPVLTNTREIGETSKSFTWKLITCKFPITINFLQSRTIIPNLFGICKILGWLPKMSKHMFIFMPDLYAKGFIPEIYNEFVTSWNSNNPNELPIPLAS